MRSNTIKLYGLPHRALLGLAILTAQLGYSAAADAAPATAPGSPLTVSVSGNHLVDASGTTVQLRGVSVSGLEFVAVQGWSAANPWGAQTGGATPNWDVMRAWKINSVRIPLNEASWLGYSCTDGAGMSRNPDPGHNYREAVESAVRQATAAGLYVILDLHWTAPGGFCPMAQNPMPDAEHSISFWRSVAEAYEGHPNVMFELFNEPFFQWLSDGADPWAALRDGGTFTQFATAGSPNYTQRVMWRSAGMQQLVDAVRSTGSRNIVLVGAPSWSQDLSRWLAYKPSDPLNQLGAVWHAYPDSNIAGSVRAQVPKLGTDAYTWAEHVLSAGVPVLITETGDHNAPGTKGAPFVSNLLPWADRVGASYLAWAWDVWSNHDNVLLKDPTGTPSDGYGEYFRQHLLCRADPARACH
jgi:endoglucanase